MTATASKYALKIRFRREQQILWTAMSVLLGAGFIAGLYWLVLQQRYGTAGGRPVSLKNWWDSGMGVIHSKSWVFYRHGIRNEGEPALWTMVGATILGKARKNQYLLSDFLLVSAAVLLLALIIAGSLGVTWIIHFGPLRHVSDAFSWQEILLGMILGRVLHVVWSPVGGTIRHRIVFHATERGGVPVWVALPLLPPAWRELWADLGGGKNLSAGKGKRHAGRIMLTVFMFVMIAVVGLLAKYAVPHGIYAPGMIS